MKSYSRQDDMSNVRSLYDEIRVIREQLLNRIELLEDEVEYLTQENMYYSKQLYQLEKDIDNEISAAEEEINNLKLNSKEKIKNIAVETSSELIKQLIGEEANNSSISAIVEEQSRKSKEKQNGF